MFSLLFWLAAIAYFGIAAKTYLSFNDTDVANNTAVRFVTSVIVPLCDFIVATTAMSILLYRAFDVVYERTRGMTMWRRIKGIIA